LAKKWRSYFLFLFLLCLVKEEFALWAGAIGIYLIFSQKQIKIGLSTIAGAIIYFFIVIGIIMPHLNYSGVNYAYGSLYPGFENGFAQGIQHYLQHPGTPFKFFAKPENGGRLVFTFY